MMYYCFNKSHNFQTGMYPFIHFKCTFMSCVSSKLKSMHYGAKSDSSIRHTIVGISHKILRFEGGSRFEIYLGGASC